MWRLINLALIMLGLFGRVSFANNKVTFLPLPTKPHVNGDNPSKKTIFPGFCGHDPSTLDFWQNLAIIPVQFTEKNKEGTILTGTFASNLIFKQIKFKLQAERKAKFLIVTRDWQEEIERKEFLKKFKHDYWLITYLPAEDNSLCSASQYKYRGSLIETFAQDQDGTISSIDSLRFWERLKTMPLTITEVKNRQVFWLFLSLEAMPNTNDNEEIVLENGLTTKKMLTFSDGTRAKISDHGILTIHKNCIFNTLESKPPKIKIAGYTLLGRPKTRPKTVDFGYFMRKLKTSLWLCYFDVTSGNLLRIVEASYDDNNEEKPKNSKNNK